MEKSVLQLEPLLETFTHYLQRKDLAPNTIASYLFGVRLFFDQHQELTPENLRMFHTFLLANYLPASANQRIHCINHFLLFLDECDPEIFPSVFQYRLPSIRLQRNSFQDQVISNGDCKKLQRKLKQEGEVFWYFVVRFLVTTGVRVSELTQIKVEHLTCGYLDLYSKGGKIRRIYIADSLCQEALEWCCSNGRNSGFLFLSHGSQPITSRGIQHQLKYFAKRYHLNPDTVYPHSFRHRFAKNFLQRCDDISLLADLMGHESIETTRIYLTRSCKEQQKLLDDIVTW